MQVREVLVRHVGQDRPDLFAGFQLATAERQGRSAFFEIDMRRLHQQYRPEEGGVNLRWRGLGDDQVVVGVDCSGRRPGLVKRFAFRSAHNHFSIRGMETGGDEGGSRENSRCC